MSLPFSIPGVHRVTALLKRSILGTHQGSFSQEHLQSYLEEFTFRFNRRLLEQAVCTTPVIEKDITYGYKLGETD